MAQLFYNHNDTTLHRPSPVAESTPSPDTEGLARELERKLARVHPSNWASQLNVTVRVSRTYAEFQTLIAALRRPSIRDAVAAGFTIPVSAPARGGV